MEIHYIWIKNFYNLKRTGINLSSKFIFEFERVNDDYLLKIYDNPDYIPTFIKEENIKNVNAIIGKNGTGKSSVLRYIKSHLPGGFNNIKNDVFVYSTTDSENSENFCVTYPAWMKLSIENATDVVFELKEYSNFKFDSHLDNCTYIYYNYMLEYGQDHGNMEGLYDISTSAILRKERTRLLEDADTLEKNRFFLMKSSDLDFLHLQEVSQAVSFLTHTHIAEDKEDLPFNKPPFLSVTIDISEKQILTDSKYGDVNDLFKKLEERKPDHSDTKDLFISNLLDAILTNFLITERKYSINNPYYHQLDVHSSESSDDYIKRFFLSMENAKYWSERYETYVEIPRLDDLSHLVSRFINIVSNMIDNKEMYVTDEFVAQISMDKPAGDNFRSFQQLYAQIKGMTPFLQFSWRSLSAGEQSYLSFMARFYSLIHDKVELKNNLCVLIDEGDMGYHPEWQRKFFKETIEFLSKQFKNYNIQLIFTSNTPFITSDLLKSNILFVEKSENGITQFVSKVNSNENTFAANIHTLFSDSFYMDGVLIGEYAKDKVNIEIIEYLKNVQSGQIPNPEIKSLIKQIGEPILRKKLEEMWNSAFGLQEELEMLKQRIREVEYKIENKEN